MVATGTFECSHQLLNALDRNILNKDPVDNPISRDSQTRSLQEQRSQTIDPRTPHP